MFSELDKELRNAKSADGYLVCLTYKEGQNLYHRCFLSKFHDDDIPSSLLEHNRALKNDMLDRQLKVKQNKK